MKPAPMMYYQPFKVPVWVIVEKGPQSQKITDWFAKKEANVVEWPALLYKAEYESFRTKGWGHIVDKPGRKHSDLLSQSFVSLNKKLNPYIDVSTNYNNLTKANRDITTDEEFAKLYHTCLDWISLTDLSRLFMVQEIAHPTQNGGCKVWVTHDTFDYTTIARLSRRVVIIGEGSEAHPADITFEELGTKFTKKLEEKLEAILNDTKLSKFDDNK